jgi:hypothetical protein
MPEKPSYDVFLSYSPQDKEWVSSFAAALREHGVRTWFDVHDLAPGERWQEKIQDALRESRALIVVLSPDSVRSPSTFFELGAAVADRKRIIPVLRGDIEPTSVPAPLSRFQFLKEASPVAAGKRVAEVIEHESVEKAEP